MVEIESSELSTLVITKPFVVVGIPAFNEERTIARVVLDAQKFADKVIVCDDGSEDYTKDIAKRLGADVIRHGKNLGYGASIKSLFKRAVELKADVLVTLDADGQHEPNEIPCVIKPIIEGVADLVIGSRFVDKNGTAEMPLYRQFGAKLITKMVNGSSKNGVTDAQSGFRAYNRLALDSLNFSEVGMGASVEILLEAGKEDLKIFEVPCSCKYNSVIGASTENPLTHGVGVVASIIRLALKERPLLALGIPAVLCVFTGIFFGTWVLQLYSETQQVANLAFASLSFVVIALMISTSMTLYAISKIMKKLR